MGHTPPLREFVRADIEIRALISVSGCALHRHATVSCLVAFLCTTLTRPSQARTPHPPTLRSKQSGSWCDAASHQGAAAAAVAAAAQPCIYNFTPNGARERLQRARIADDRTQRGHIHITHTSLYAYRICYMSATTSRSLSSNQANARARASLNKRGGNAE